MKRLFLLVLALWFLAAGGALADAVRTKAEVEQLVKTLKTAKDGKARAAAANQITETGMVRAALARPAEAALIEALKDGDGEVRLAAIQALMTIEPYKRDRVPNLLGLLKDGENRNTRVAAVDMLGKTEGGAKEALPLIVDMQKKELDKADNMRDGQLLQTIGPALVGIRQHLLGGYVTALKTEKDAKARAAAAVELGKIAQGNADQAKAIAPKLVEAMADEDLEVRKAVMASLVQAKPEPQLLVPALIVSLKNPREDRTVRLGVIALLTSAGPNAKEALPFLEFILEREGKKADKDKELVEKLTQAVETIKK